MIVVANGNEVELADGATLAELIETLGLSKRLIVAERNGEDETLGLSKRLIVAERNGEAIPRRAITETVLLDGDRLELVRAVAGG